MTNSTKHVPLTQRAMLHPLFLGLVMLLALSGCGISHIRVLREAQETFSRAAEVENRNRLGDPTAIADVTEATTSYRLAAQMLEELVSKKAKELRNDNLLCTSLTIQVLALWRLGEHNKALRTSETASSCAPGNDPSLTPPRERALLRALPGLVRIDQANAKVGNDQRSLQDFEQVSRLILDAQQDLEAARNSVPKNHPVQVYLLNSELAALRVRQAAITEENLPSNRQRQELEAAKERITEKLQVYQDFLKQERGDEEANRAIKPWLDVFGLTSQDLN